MRQRVINLFSVALVCAAAFAQPAQSADLLVVNKIRSGQNLEGNLAFVDLASGQVVARIPVGKEPHEVAASQDGRFAVVSNTGSYQQPGNTLSAIDVAARQEIHRVDLGPLWNPHGIVAHNGLFYFTAEGARAIAAYDPVANKLVWIMGTGQGQTHMLAFSPDGKNLVTANRGSGSVSVFDLTGADPLFPSAWKETIIPVCEGPEGIDISPDGREAWVGCHGENGIAIVDLAQKKVTGSVATHTRSLARVKFTSGGRYLLATDPGNGELAIFDAASRQELKRLKMGAGSEAIFPEGDGRHVLIGVTNEDNVAEVDLETMSIVRRLSTGKGPDGMAWIGK
jgi:DNA-binding beta-propeller fold protein YncE